MEQNGVAGMNALEERYGPSWKLVAEYIQEVPGAFTLAGSKALPPDVGGTIVAVRDLGTLARVLGCSLAESSRGREAMFFDCPREDTAFVQFLLLVDRVDTENTALAESNGLRDAVMYAVNDACNTFPLAGFEDFFEYVGAVPEHHGYDCDFTVQAHCGYIATEMVVAHLTPHHLLRDMWRWYRQGYWPCGWVGKWPEGRLIVF
jgi:hypothetical protein